MQGGVSAARWQAAAASDLKGKKFRFEGWEGMLDRSWAGERRGALLLRALLFRGRGKGEGKRYERRRGAWARGSGCWWGAAAGAIVVMDLAVFLALKPGEGRCLRGKRAWRK